MHLVRSLLVLCSVATLVVQARVDVVSAGTVFSGVDNSNPDTRGTEVFKNPENHVKAVASILYHSAKVSKFLPKEQGLEASTKDYGRFVGRAFSFDGFHSVHKGHEKLELTGDIDQFKQQIAEKYKSSSGKAIIPAYVYGNQIPDSLSEESEQWLLTLAALHGGDDDTVTFDLSSVSVKLSDRDGDVHLDKQTTHLRQFTFKVDRKYLEKHAHHLAERIEIISVDDFLEELSTPYQGDDDLTAWLGGLTTPRRQDLYPLSQLRLRH
ncbi:hypothetical protein BGX34_002039 [Mortierella sp. NVP85]|nr:hypothetical protein BGX34_002039 [Mortierella sp. NVP85]